MTAWLTAKSYKEAHVHPSGGDKHWCLGKTIWGRTTLHHLIYLKSRWILHHHHHQSGTQKKKRLSTREEMPSRSLVITVSTHWRAGIWNHENHITLQVRPRTLCYKIQVAAWILWFFWNLWKYTLHEISKVLNGQLFSWKMCFGVLAFGFWGQNINL